MGRTRWHLRGLRAGHVSKVYIGIMRELNGSSKEVSVDKCTSEETEKVIKKSDGS
jgi:hypothetical protein